MEIKEFPNIKAAIGATTKKIRVKHTFKPGEVVKLHFHPMANEWVVVDNGEFQVRLGEEKRTFNLQHQAIAIHFPIGQKHALWAISGISYFVFRDKKDRTIYCE